MTKKLILETAEKSTAIKFVEFLRSNDISYEILDADNLMNYNEGVFNVGIHKISDTILFINGKSN